MAQNIKYRVILHKGVLVFGSINQCVYVALHIAEGKTPSTSLHANLFQTKQHSL